MADTAEPQFEGKPRPTWGQTIALARLQAIEKWGSAPFVYDELADDIEEAADYPTSGSTIKRLHERAAVPEQRRTRLLSILTLWSLGRDPVKFGFNRSEIPQLWLEAGIDKKLHPENRIRRSTCSAKTASDLGKRVAEPVAA